MIVTQMSGRNGRKSGVAHPPPLGASVFAKLRWTRWRTGKA